MCRDGRLAWIRVAAGVTLLLLVAGCGLRAPQTGSLSGRVVNVRGDVVPQAEVYSLFNTEEKATTALDGGFYISELPAGRNRIVVRHPTYRLEERDVEIQANGAAAMGEVVVDWATSGQLITNVVVDSITPTSAEFAWKTYKPAVCDVQYGTDTAYPLSVPELDPVIDHRVKLTGLTPGTLYRGRVRLVDERGTSWFSYDRPFMTTLGPEAEPPARVWLEPLAAFGVVTVAWEASVSSAAAGYEVFRREPGQDWVRLTDQALPVDARSHTDRTAKGGHFYAYAVRTMSREFAYSTRRETGHVFMPGQLTESLILTASESPILLVSDLVVAPATTLTVREGVEFRVASADVFRLGLDHDRVEILVQGRLDLSGTTANPVNFTLLDGIGLRDNWAGITIQKGSTGNSTVVGAKLTGCASQALIVDGLEVVVRDLEVTHSGAGLVFRNIRSLPAMTGLRFSDLASTAVVIENCRRTSISGMETEAVAVGLSVQTGNPEDRLTLADSTIRARDIGVTGRFSRSLIQNTLLISPMGIGVSFLEASGTGNVLDHCTIDAATGIVIAKGVPVIENSIITSISGGKVGIQYLPAGVPQFSYNDVYGFTQAYVGCAAGVGAQSLAPDFIGGNPYEYNLQAASPLKTRDRHGREMGRYGVSYY